MKTLNKITSENIESKNIKWIKENAQVAYSRLSYNYKNDDVQENLMGQTLLELVRDNSNDFTKDIALKALEQKRELTDKQAWCIAYQIINNLEVYVLAMEKYNDECVEIENTTYNVGIRVETEKLTETFEVESFDNLIDAKKLYNQKLENSISSYNDGEFSEYFNEIVFIDKVTKNNVEEIDSEYIYCEGKKDKNNYKGDFANWYWFKASRIENELVYNFYFEGEIQYSGIKESNLSNWYNK